MTFNLRYFDRKLKKRANKCLENVEGYSSGFRMRPVRSSLFAVPGILWQLQKVAWWCNVYVSLTLPHTRIHIYTLSVTFPPQTPAHFPWETPMRWRRHNCTCKANSRRQQAGRWTWNFPGSWGGGAAAAKKTHKKQWHDRNMPSSWLACTPASPKMTAEKKSGVVRRDETGGEKWETYDAYRKCRLLSVSGCCSSHFVYAWTRMRLQLQLQQKEGQKSGWKIWERQWEKQWEHAIGREGQVGSARQGRWPRVQV